MTGRRHFRTLLRTTLLCLLSAVTPAHAVRVWLPDARQVADLTRTGLHFRGGQLAVLPGFSSAPYRPVSVALAPGVTLTRTPLTPGASDGPVRVRVTASGRVLGERTVAFFNEVFPTRRGPCLAPFADAPPARPAQCFTPDLRAVWATLPSTLLSVNAAGTVAYTAPDFREADAGPYRPEVPVTRHDLVGGGTRTLTLHTVPPGTDLQGSGFLQFAQVMHARSYLSGWTPLAGSRFLACVQETHLHSGCHLLLLDRVLHVLRRLADGMPSLPTASPDGVRVLMLGSSLHVWDTGSGRALVLRDPRWDAEGREPYAAYFTVDGGAVVVVTGVPDEQAPAPGFSARPGSGQADRYRLPDGRYLGSFPVRP